MKNITYIALAGILSVGLLNAADFSKKSDKEFIELAGSVPAADVPDYVLETKKRVNKKLYPEAKEYQKAKKTQEMEALKKLTPEQRQQRAIEVCKDFLAKTDKMTGKEIREAGLKLPPNNCNEAPKGFHAPKPPKDAPKNAPRP